MITGKSVNPGLYDTFWRTTHEVRDVRCHIKHRAVNRSKCRGTHDKKLVYERNRASSGFLDIYTTHRHHR